MKPKVVAILAAAGLWLSQAGAVAADAPVAVGQPSVFWHEGEWQTYKDGVWTPYFRKVDSSRFQPGPSGVATTRPTAGIGQTTIGIGQPQGRIGRPNTQIGQTTIGIAQPNGQIGSTTIGIGKPQGQLGQTTIGIGQPNRQIGQTTIGIGRPQGQIGQTTIGIGKPQGQMSQTTIGIGQPNVAPAPLRPVSRPDDSPENEKNRRGHPRK